MKRKISFFFLHPSSRTPEFYPRTPDSEAPFSGSAVALSPGLKLRFAPVSASQEMLGKCWSKESFASEVPAVILGQSHVNDES